MQWSLIISAVVPRLSMLLTLEEVATWTWYGIDSFSCRILAELILQKRFPKFQGVSVKDISTRFQDRRTFFQLLGLQRVSKSLTGACGPQKGLYGTFQLRDMLYHNVDEIVSPEIINQWCRDPERSISIQFEYCKNHLEYINCGPQTTEVG